MNYSLRFLYIIHSILYDIHLENTMTSSLMNFIREYKSSLQFIPAQSPLETSRGVDGGSFKNQVSTRYFYVAKRY
jgi:hypothetical protein